MASLISAYGRSDGLSAHPWTGDFLEEGEPDKVIGQYRLMRKIGEGGMGQVWLAEQSEPLQRLVALKLIHGGIFDPSLLRRFQAERQSLATMDHPAIAKVFDAGTTESGQPYFVMEYVPGEPITGDTGDGGPATAAELNQPTSLVLDQSGNLYFVVFGSQVIRVVNMQPNSIVINGATNQPGDIQTIAGTGVPGYSGDFGPVTAATFTASASLRLDPAGNLYFTDTGNNVVREIFASSGTIRTVAGTGYRAIQIVGGVPELSTLTGNYTDNGGLATSADLFVPYDMLLNAFGNLVIADGANQVVRQVSASPAGFICPDTQVGTTSASEIYTFSNISSQTVTFTGLTVSANFKQVPSGLTDCTATITLPAAGVCYLTLAFAPTEVGPLTGTAQTTNSAGVQTIALSGTGTAADSAVLQNIMVTPVNPSIAAGTTQQITATGIYSDGSTQNITTTVTWASSNASYATIGPATCLATSVTAGSTQITATLGTIVSPPDTLTVSATLTAQTITVTAAAPASAAYNATFNVAAMASSGLPVSISGSGACSGTGTSTSGSTVTITMTPSSGTCTVTYTQAGNGNHAAAAQVTNTTTATTAPVADFTVSGTPSSQSVSPGSAAMYTVNVGSVNGSFTSAVTLSVTGLPPGATGNFFPSSVTPGSEGGTSTLTVQTAITLVRNQRSSPPWSKPSATILAGVFGILLLLPLRRTRKRWRNLLFTMVAFAMLGATAVLSGCGGGFGFCQQSQTYTLTITGASGSDTHFTPVKLTVQ